MRLTTVILLASLLQVSGSTLAQKISLTKSNAPLKAVLKEIKNQSGYDFIATESLFKMAKPVSINIRNTDFEAVLKQVFDDQPLTYSINSTTITIKEKSPSLLDRARDVIQSATKDLLQDLIVRGRILDEGGRPLEGATVVLKGSNRTVKTDVKGEFVLANVPDDGVLVIRYVGYKQLEIGLKDAVMPLEIKLNVATGELEEVKVVYNTGYQELNKERATGSFVQIDNELFNRRVGGTVLERIDNLVPGMLVRGENTGNQRLDNYTIRGVSTINASKRPLLVVDNFIYEGDPDQLNPNDVESVTILKDAVAASIWGARAGNGVIVITSKKGKLNSGPSLSFNSNVTVGEKPDLFKMPAVTSKDVIALQKRRFTEGYYDGALSDDYYYPALSQLVEILALQRSGIISTDEANAQITKYEQHDVRKDIQKYLLQTAIAQQHHLGVSGGGDLYRYSGSVGYNHSRPNEINIKNEGITLNFNNTWTPIKNLEINALLNWMQTTGQSKNSLGGYNDIIKGGPNQRLADEDGNVLSIPKNYRMGYVDTVSFPGKLDWHYSPLNEARNGNVVAKGYNTRINGSINYVILKGLKIDLSYSWQKGTSDNTRIQDLNTYYTRNLINTFTQTGPNNLPVYPYPLGGIYNRSNTDQSAWTSRAGLTFSRTFDKHEIGSVFGTEINESKSNITGMPTQFGFNPATNVFGAIKPGTWVRRPGGGSQMIGVELQNLLGKLNRFGSNYGILGYTYDQKYTLTASGRIDQSNFFGVEANDRKKPTWSAGLKWDIGKEKFYDISEISLLTLRATYGYSGNTNPGISPFATANYYSGTDPLYVPYAKIVTSPNPELIWEKVRQINLALDFALNDQRISGSLEVYQKKAIDLISAITVDPTSGFLEYTGNNSSIQVKGVELALSTKNLDGAFKWNSTLNVAFQRDKVVAYSVAPPETGGQFEGVIIGKPLSALYSFRWAGINPADGDAQFYIGDQKLGSSYENVFLKVKQEDLVYQGQTSPTVFGGFRHNFSYKNIAISLNLTYQFGHYFRRETFGGNFDDSGLWQHEDYLKTWKVAGDEQTTNVPGFLDYYPDNRYAVYQAADILVEKADHIRLQDVRLSYSLSKTAVKSLPFKNISLYLYANNLGIVWKASKYNPDTKNGLIVPPLKTIAFGLNLTF